MTEPAALKHVPSPTATDASQQVAQVKGEARPPVQQEEAAKRNGVHSSGTISVASASARPQPAALAGDLAAAGCGPVNDANQLVAVLVASRGTNADLLRGLSQLSGSMKSGDPRRSFYEGRFSAQLHKAMSGLTPAQRSRAAARLASPAVAALLHTLREGVGPVRLGNRAATASAVSQIGQQLAKLQQRFGAGRAAEPTEKDFKQARKAVDDFARQFDSGRVGKSGKLDADQISSMQMGYRPLDNDELARNPASRMHGQVSRDFVEESPRNCYLLQHEDGRCEWLLSPQLEDAQDVLDSDQIAKLAAERLLQFCGGDAKACLAVSQAATESVAKAVDLDSAIITGEFPHVTGSRAGEGDPAVTTGRGVMKGQNALTGFVIRKAGDGNYQVIARRSEQLVDQNSRGGPIALNPNQSHWNTEVAVAVGADGRPRFEGAQYSFAAATHLGKVDDSQPASPDGIDSRAASAELLAQQERVSVFGDFAALPVNEDLVRASSGTSPAEMSEQLVAAGTLTSEQASGILDRIEFADIVDQEIAAIDINSERGIEELTEKVGNLASDLRLMQQDLLLKAQVWGAGLDQQQVVQLNTFLVRVADDLGGRAQRIEEVAAERAAALDDARGDINEVVSGALLARSENALSQARANVAAMHGIVDDIERNSSNDLSEGARQALNKLLRQVEERSSARQLDLDSARQGSGSAQQAPGPGARGQDLDRHSRAMGRALAAGQPLPQVHEQLSEAQLFRLQVDDLLRQHPELELHFSDFNSRHAAAIADLIAQGDWQRIESSFHDLDEQGRLQKLTSTITPAPQFDDPGFQHSYRGMGVASGNRTQGRHAANLAHSELVDGAGKTVFSGLRHGILDGYRIVPKQLARMSDDKLWQLIGDTLLDDRQWRDFVQQREGEIGSRNELQQSSFDLIRAGGDQVLQLAAERARTAANVNAARELATAAVLSNPVLRSQALINRQITVDLDSISLVTPDRLRGFIGAHGERTYLANQTAALNSLADRPFTVRIGDQYSDREVEVEVTLRPRMFNFGVNSYAVGTGGTRTLLKGFMGWDEADQMNRQSLASLIGDPDRIDEVGGEAGQLLSWLEGSDQGGQVPETVKATVSPNTGVDGSSERRASAFDDHARRAEAIRNVARQIKEIFSRRSHHRSGNEPYKLASRVALLSNLLGRSTCYNCKSGKDRTGHLDAAAKQLAVDAAAGRNPVPDAAPNQRRTTNFVLKTGNLEMQQHNTGLRGYKLFGVRALFAQLISPLARMMFSGDSKLVKS